MSELAMIHSQLTDMNNRLIRIEQFLTSDVEHVEYKEKHQEEIQELLRIVRIKSPMISIEALIKEAQKLGISKEVAYVCLEKMRRSGDVFEPKKGFIQRI